MVFRPTCLQFNDCSTGRNCDTRKLSDSQQYRSVSYKKIAHDSSLPVAIPDLLKNYVYQWGSNIYNWGKPIGKNKTVHWTSCPALKTPHGVSSINCNESNCIGICKPGYRPLPGRKKVTCQSRKSDKAKWHGELGKCHTCPPLPVDNVICFVKGNNRRVCVIPCTNDIESIHKVAKCACSFSTQICQWKYTKVVDCKRKNPKKIDSLYTNVVKTV